MHLPFSVRYYFTILKDGGNDLIRSVNRNYEPFMEELAKRGIEVKEKVV